MNKGENRSEGEMLALRGFKIAFFLQKKIRVTIIRSGRAKRLELVPRVWSGKGVLGCSVLPVTSARLI